jgi:hypothetical protein
MGLIEQRAEIRLRRDYRRGRVQNSVRVARNHHFQVEREFCPHVGRDPSAVGGNQPSSDEAAQSAALPTEETANARISRLRG